MLSGAVRAANLVNLPLDAQIADGSLSLAEQLPDTSGSPADVAERQGQIALIHIALNFLIERKCFQSKTVELFRAVTLEQREPKEVAKDLQDVHWERLRSEARGAR